MCWTFFPTKKASIDAVETSVLTIWINLYLDS